MWTLHGAAHSRRASATRRPSTPIDGEPARNGLSLVRRQVVSQQPGGALIDCDQNRVVNALKLAEGRHSQRPQDLGFVDVADSRGHALVEEDIGYLGLCSDEGMRSGRQVLKRNVVGAKIRSKVLAPSVCRPNKSRDRSVEADGFPSGNSNHDPGTFPRLLPTRTGVVQMP